MINVLNKWYIYLSDTYIQYTFSDISAYNVLYILVHMRNYGSLSLFSSRVLQADTAHSKDSFMASVCFH